MNYQILDWDSNLFGIKVAKIIEPDLSADEIKSILCELKQKSVELVYWASDKKCNDEIKQLEGRLVDIKTTFIADLSNLSSQNNDLTDIVEPYSRSMPIVDLEDLAIQSGEFSRFAVDPNFKRTNFIALYKIWINKSINKEIAKQVLVIKEYNKIIGMITLGEKNGRGDIGLLAVCKNYRGKGYGEKLVSAAQSWFIQNGYTTGQVVTQDKNISACNFYKKYGYSVDKIEYFYHFWL
ncbi:MAG: GNAT family N-acetyltransferase [Candidatus Delongbacteria bacterium]|nr:GNAT family N-acetyltransferase [Candidatus Delongbacteria bacterium]